MRRLEVKLIETGRPSVFGALFLAVGLLCAACGAAMWFIENAERAQLRARHQSLQTQRAATAGQISKVSDPKPAERYQRIVAAHETLMQPWAARFETLESIVLKDVAVIGLEAVEGEVRVTIRARSVNVALQFADRLSADGFTEVTPLSQQKLDGDEFPIKLSLSAKWPALRSGSGARL